MPGGLTRVVEHRTTCRSSRCSAAAAARTRGCSPTVRSAPSRCCAPARSDAARAGARPSCRAASPRTCSGSAATSSAPSTSSGSCAASCRAWPIRTRPTIRASSSALLHVLVDLELLPEELGEDTLAAQARGGHASISSLRQNPHAGLRNALNEVRRLASARPRPALDRHVAHPEPAAAGHAPAAGPHPVRRRARAPEPHDHGPRGVQRHGDGEHDARPRLALPGPRPPARAIAEPHRRAAQARSASPRNAAPDSADASEPLLEIADSSMTYRRRYFAQPQLAPALDLLLADDTNTRGLAFQLAAVSEHILRLPRDPQGAVADARRAVDRAARATRWPRSSSPRAWSERSTARRSTGCSDRSRTT